MSVFLFFLASVVLITASGALAPGPLLFSNLSHAPRWGWKGGLWLSIGHTLVELPLVILVAVGLNIFINNPLLQLLTAGFGGTALLVFAGLQIRDALRSDKRADTSEPMQVSSSRHPFLAGLVFTGLNPFFLVWWLTAGARLVVDALILGAFAGVLVMFLAHVWMDYAWLVGTAWLANKGSNLTGTRGYTALTIVFAVALVYFGVSYVWTAVILSGVLA
jgi:threonine/homoserine/homoserine lactone efflux protein